MREVLSRGAEFATARGVRRTIVAVAWVVCTTLPLMIAAVFVVGCCVLPFHGLIHRALPMCHLAADFLGGEHHDDDTDHHPTPPPERRQVSGPSLVMAVNARAAIARADVAGVCRVHCSPVAHRSYISLGAVRCDQDVGLQRLLIVTFLI